MFRYSSLISYSLFWGSFLILTSAVFANPKITDQKERLLIIASHTPENNQANDVLQKCLSILSNEATSLKRFNVYDRNKLDLVLKEQALQWSGIGDENSAVEAGKITGAKQAITLELISFSQEGVPPESEKKKEEKKENIIEKIFFHNVEKYPNNIQTQLQIVLTKLNLETGQSLNSYTFSNSHTGGTKAQSLNQVLSKFRSSANTKLRSFFLMHSVIKGIQGNQLWLPLGSDMGIREGMIFIVQNPQQTRNIDGVEYDLPSENIAISRVSQVSKNSHYEEILRKWGVVSTEAEVQEHLKTPTAIEFSVPYNNALARVQSFQLDIALNPYSTLSAGLGFRISNFADSRDETSFGAGIHFFVGKPIFLSRSLALDTRIALVVDGAFRGDNDGHQVHTALFSIPVEEIVHLQLSKKWNVIFGGGYRFLGQSNSWSYTEDSKNHDAVWNGSAPNIDLSGTYLRAGFEYISF